jgi:hypothetical protein
MLSNVFSKCVQHMFRTRVNMCWTFFHNSLQTCFQNHTACLQVPQQCFPFTCKIILNVFPTYFQSALLRLKPIWNMIGHFRRRHRGHGNRPQVLPLRLLAPPPHEVPMPWRLLWGAQFYSCRERDREREREREIEREREREREINVVWCSIGAPKLFQPA